VSPVAAYLLAAPQQKDFAVGLKKTGNDVPFRKFCGQGLPPCVGNRTGCATQYIARQRSSNVSLIYLNEYTMVE